MSATRNPSTAAQVAARAAGEPLLDIQGLAVRFGRAAQSQVVVDDVTLALQRGRVLALVGESGSGKTLVSRAILGLLPPGAAISGGAIRFNGRNLAATPEKQMQAVRGGEIGMVFQEPMTSLNPALTVGFQMAEGLKRHRRLPDSECRRLAIDMLRRVNVPDPEDCLGKYPHEFSGGLRQRILIASVLMLKPALLIADEPTTALDVLVQKQVLDILMQVTRELGTAVLLISHDLGLVARYAHRVAVMYRGRLMEEGAVADILLAPRHRYTRKLLNAMPHRALATGPAGAPSETLMSVDKLHVAFRGRRKVFWRPPPVFHAVRGVSLEVRRGETLVIVGESGSGKTTLARAMLGLVVPRCGQVMCRGVDIATLDSGALRRFRSRLQMVFQDPYSALDPRMRINAIVAESLRHKKAIGRAERDALAAKILEEVGLGAEYGNRFPHELSGGQRQRVNIARALICEPEFIVADEPVSALDITVQAEILELYRTLQQRHNFACVFITHDLSVVEQIADRVLVMYRGQVVEEGDRDRVLDHPQHPYTCRLLEAAPRLAPVEDGSYRVTDWRSPPNVPPSGYRFDGWEKTAGPPRPLVNVSPGHRVAAEPVTQAEKSQ